MNKRTNRRSELAGFLAFSRETLASFGLALILIVYVVQAFRIPSESMRDSLLVGDQLLALKFTYGAPVLPFTDFKFPGLKQPKPGEPVIFRAPNNHGKDYIKRCVAGPGQVVEIRNSELIVDGETTPLPKEAKLSSGGHYPVSGIDNFAPLRIPARGDSIDATTMSTRDLLFLKHLIRQEQPHKRVTMRMHLTIDGVESTSAQIGPNPGLTLELLNNRGAFEEIDTWIGLESAIGEIKEIAQSVHPGRTIEVRPAVYVDSRQVSRYTARNDNYFMVGDNRDNSLDSRFWGYVNDRRIRAQALIIYFSMDPEAPLWNPIRKIRWDRIGKLIRSSEIAAKAAEGIGS